MSFSVVSVSSPCLQNKRRAQNHSKWPRASEKPVAPIYFSWSDHQDHCRILSPWWSGRVNVELVFHLVQTSRPFPAHPARFEQFKFNLSDASTFRLLAFLSPQHVSSGQRHLRFSGLSAMWTILPSPRASEPAPGSTLWRQGLRL